MAELTDQQGHLQQVLEQQKTLVAEINELNNTVATKREMALKLQGVREYLEQTGVTLPEPEAGGRRHPREWPRALVRLRAAR